MNHLTKTQINERISSIRKQLKAAKDWNEITGSKSIPFAVIERLNDVEYEAKQLVKDIRKSQLDTYMTER